MVRSCVRTPYPHPFCSHASRSQRSTSPVISSRDVSESWCVAWPLGGCKERRLGRAGAAQPTSTRARVAAAIAMTWRARTKGVEVYPFFKRPPSPLLDGSGAAMSCGLFDLNPTDLSPPQCGLDAGATGGRNRLLEMGFHDARHLQRVQREGGVTFATAGHRDGTCGRACRQAPPALQTESRDAPWSGHSAVRAAA